MMKKNLFTLSLLLISAVCVFAQRYYDVSYSPMCIYAGSSSLQRGLWDPSDYAVDINKKVCRVLETEYIPIYRGNVPNACATVVNQGYKTQPVIVYNRDFMGKLHRINNWAPIGVVAHEAGHHYNGDMYESAFSMYSGHLTYSDQMQKNWDNELEADFVSGYVLAKMGAGLEDATVTWQKILVSDGSYTHPNSHLRVEAVKLGWYKGKER